MQKPIPKNTICLWFDKDALDAARFYAATFPDSEVTAVHHAPSDYPSGKEGDVLTVEFTVLGIPCLGLNGGPDVKHSWAFSFQVATDTQEETDRYWNAIVSNGGAESACGWCTDRWGLSWQITFASADRGDRRRRGGGETRLRSDDGDGENRHRKDRGRAPRVTRRDCRFDALTSSTPSIIAVAAQQLAVRFGGETNSLVRELEAFRRKLEAEPDRMDAAVRERQKAETLAFLDRQIRGFQFSLECCAEEEGYEEDARQAVAVLPDVKTLDKILRHETKLERQMYRAMAQLERVQRMRRGEAIPAPLSVKVSDRR